ncbi:glycoside hydrolase family 3 N-terminal domain-containing protein [Salinibacterium sp. G-O1]|uniref:beta-glucosidase n=1 Tax=Salinibacterium sp. G-O1 TaxID=3046208 RepID=UPI0024BBD24B|nr:glycoside hydrolase family 3 N-terminal domain-containing protein [Salinibacterium sp. G-O1]MDJ0336311.1 glycoside hydrolase family 3 N-terminal domain-containing protein [Salinibacterium sp. G-O1]
MTTLPLTSIRAAAWHDVSLSDEQRATAALSEMTLQEKVAQLVGYWFDKRGAGEVVAPMQDTLGAARPPFDEVAPFGLGHFTRVIGTEPGTVSEVTERLSEKQQMVVDASRLGIPAIAHEECLTGVNSLGATVYPAPLAWGATFDPTLARRVGEAIGADLRALGVHQGLSPVLDVVRDYRWGRVEETIGEDPVLVAAVGCAYTSGLEASGLIATLKHFVGYSASVSGRNHAPVAAGPRDMADVMLVPFELAVRESGVRSVMNSYSDIDGVPVAADRALLTELLRDEWGFTGTVVSDYWAIAFLATAHGVAPDAAAAGALSLAAGMDVELPNGMCFPPLVDAVRAGQIDEALIDRAVHRVLVQKSQLGLLDENPGTGGRVVDLDSSENRSLARAVAEASIVLLRNDEELLPLSPNFSGRVAVLGPMASEPRSLLGCYSYPVHVLPRYPEFGLGIAVPSFLEAFRSEFPHAIVTHETGASFLGAETGNLERAVELARDADLVVLTVGDLPGMFGRGTSGEGCDAADLTLPGSQSELVNAVLDTGTSVILVTNSGRPYAFTYGDRILTAVQTFIPGEEGAGALAGVLSGRVNPGGKLPVQIPHTSGGGQHLYLGAPLTRTIDKISNQSTSPVFAFGHGLSYTTFTLSPAALADDSIDVDGTTTLSVDVINTGAVGGSETVQVYLSDPVASVARPVQKLVGFARVTLEPGESAQVSFTISPDLSAYTGIDLRRIVDPGELVLSVGTSSRNLICALPLTVTGESRPSGHNRMIISPVAVNGVSLA